MASQVRFCYGDFNSLGDSEYGDIVFDANKKAIYAQGHKFKCPEENDGYWEEDIPPYLCFTSISGTSTVGMDNIGSLNIVYSFDGATYTVWNGSNLTLTEGQSVYFKGSNLTIEKSFKGTGNLAVSGEVSSLLDPSCPKNISTFSSYCFVALFANMTCIKDISNLFLPNILTSHCCQTMFAGCTGLTSLSSGLLPATNLTENCYFGMFLNCTGLTSIPSDLLPATNLAEYCYSLIFSGCTGLTSIPSGLLPATNLVACCYLSMFGACTGLTSIPSDLLPATNFAFAAGCYENMFGGCTGLTSIPSNLLPASTLVEGCYRGMFQDCTSLTTAPNLPATTLVSLCYIDMFKGCTSLNYIKADFLSTPSEIFMENWVNGVASSGTFVKNPDATWKSKNYRGVSGVPSGWIVENEQADPQSYEVNLNNQWRTMSIYSSISGINMSDYDAYESFSNYNVHNQNAYMDITFSGYSKFTIYVDSYGENNWDYIVVCPLNSTPTTPPYSSGYKFRTYGLAKIGNVFTNYTAVVFESEITNVDGPNTIRIFYRKDGSGNSYDDRGYVLIPKNQPS